MDCPRCHRIMFQETYDDLKGTSGQRIQAEHCVICGNIVDPVILRNRQQTIPPVRNRARLAIVTSY